MIQLFIGILVSSKNLEILKFLKPFRMLYEITPSLMDNVLLKGLMAS